MPRTTRASAHVIRGRPHHFEIFPGTDGLVHISELAHKRVKRVEDVLQEGDEVLVKVIGMQDGKIKLSRKQALTEEPKAEEAAPAPAAAPQS